MRGTDWTPASPCKSRNCKRIKLPSKVATLQFQNVLQQVMTATCSAIWTQTMSSHTICGGTLGFHKPVQVTQHCSPADNAQESTHCMMLINQHMQAKPVNVDQGPVTPQTWGALPKPHLTSADWTRHVLHTVLSPTTIPRGCLE
jgi:hypothetical protein